MHVQLKPLRREDLDFLRELRNTLHDSFFDSHIITEAQQDIWYRFNYLVSNTVFWIIWKGKQRIGAISRTQIEHEWPLYEIGNLMLLPEYQGQGIMLDAMQQLINCCLGAFYTAQVKPDNTASLRLFDKAGFWRTDDR